MRWIFAVLLVVNLAYLAYEFTQPKAVPLQDVVEVSAVGDAKPLKLLSEVSLPSKVAPKSGKKEALCWAVGPYAVKLDAKHVYARMVALDIPSKVESQSVLVKQEYWVYLAPFANKKQALRKLKELQKRKVDSFVITEGELANGISLGLFGKRSSVERLLKKLAHKNIKAKVKELQRKRNQYWVMSPVDRKTPLTEKLRSRLLEGRKMEWRQLHCESGLPKA